MMEREEKRGEELYIVIEREEEERRERGLGYVMMGEEEKERREGRDNTMHVYI